MKTYRKSIQTVLKQTLTCAATLAIAAAASAQAQGVLADDLRSRPPVVLPPQSQPYGESYAQWAADWWNWALSIPAEINPAADPTGTNAAVGQHGPVWFLAGAVGSGPLAVTRTVTIPEGKALFFPIVNTLWTTGPSDPPTTIPDILNALAGVTAFSASLS